MLDTQPQTSAGGVVFRRTAAETIEIALIAVGRRGRWQLPKGTIEANETPEQAAVREVREETGLHAELLERLATIEYWYIGDYAGGKTRFHKQVHFFLMRYTAGDVSDHDDEVLEARWTDIGAALEILAFKNEHNVTELARTRIQSLNESN
ncbi:MAG: NUDIX hydrolase [Planctomycetota bacterium]|nr:NUDIX hydrolase [Planctomycetota bacterium]